MSLGKQDLNSIQQYLHHEKPKQLQKVTKTSKEPEINNKKKFLSFHMFVANLEKQESVTKVSIVLTSTPE